MEQGGKIASYLQCQSEFSWLDAVDSVFKMETKTAPDNRCVGENEEKEMLAKLVTNY